MALFFHLGFFTWQEPGLANVPPLARMPLTSLFADGWVGVEIFFLLSGFVIAYSTEGATPRRFVRHRLLRLLPTAFLCASITALAKLYNHQPPELVLHLWLHSVLLSPVGLWIDGSYWTLPIELAFYVLVLLTLLRAKGRYLFATMACLGVGSTISCLLLLTTPTWVSPGLLAFLASCWFPPHACLIALYGVFFAFGVLLYSALQHGAHWQHRLLLPVCLVRCLAEILWHGRGSATGLHLLVARSLPVGLWLAGLASLIVSARKTARSSSASGAGVCCSAVR